MPAISPDSLLSLERWDRQRKTEQASHIAHRRRRSVALGEHMTLQFEDERTVRYQIQEMLRIERIFEEAGIRDEIEVYAPLVPDGRNWKATLMLAYPDPVERRRELARLIGVEDRMFVEVEGHARVFAIADEDLPRETADKTSAVHFLRFEFSPSLCAAIRSRARVQIGCDHVHYPHLTPVPVETLASLASDLNA